MEPQEHFFECPYCGEKISMLLDPSVGAAKYIEDCEVCCAPIEVSYESEDSAITSFDARAIDA